MANLTSGSIKSHYNNFNSSEVVLKVILNGNAISKYTQPLPVFNPAGFFSIPMPGRLALNPVTPYGNSGYICGFANESPATSNVVDLVAGEAAICETSGFNFNIKAKLDKLMSTFTNTSNENIDTTITIGENVVTVLSDIIAEIDALETKINSIITYTNQIITTITTLVSPGGGVPLSPLGTLPILPYTPTSNFTRDGTFINVSPSQMYININGKVIA